MALATMADDDDEVSRGHVPFPRTVPRYLISSQLHRALSTSKQTDTFTTFFPPVLYVCNLPNPSGQNYEIQFRWILSDHLFLSSTVQTVLLVSRRIWFHEIIFVILKKYFENISSSKDSFYRDIVVENNFVTGTIRLFFLNTHFYSPFEFKTR